MHSTIAASAKSAQLMEITMQRLMTAKAMCLFPLLLLSTAAVTPANANWFHTPGSTATRNVGSAPNPDRQDIRAYRRMENAYPLVSRMMNEKGKVGLHATLTENGRVDEVWVERTSGFARLDTAATRFIKANWRYRGAQPMPKTVLIDVNYALD